MKLPTSGAYIRWGFTERTSFLEWDLTVRADPGTSVGQYIALHNGTIDGSAFYLGLQTDVFRPASSAGVGDGWGIGKGLIFSTWWSFDAADTRVPDDGFIQLGTHEGSFVGVRCAYPWTVGNYRVRLARSDTDTLDGRQLDWFALHIQPTTPAGSATQPSPSGPVFWAGSLRFPRRDAEIPAGIDAGGTAFFEVYSRASTWSSVPRLTVDMMAYSEHGRCPGGRTEYPVFPDRPPMPNIDAHHDESRDRIVLDAGTGVARVHEASVWPSPAPTAHR